jgi:hypothetical protein
MLWDDIGKVQHRLTHIEIAGVTSKVGRLGWKIQGRRATPPTGLCSGLAASAVKKQKMFSDARPEAAGTGNLPRISP